MGALVLYTFLVHYSTQLVCYSIQLICYNIWLVCYSIQFIDSMQSNVLYVITSDPDSGTSTKSQIVWVQFPLPLPPSLPIGPPSAIADRVMQSTQTPMPTTLAHSRVSHNCQRASCQSLNSGESHWSASVT